MDMEQYRDELVETAFALIGIDSPSGYTADISEYICHRAEALGFPVERQNLGNLTVTAEGTDNGRTVALASHIDTVGMMVRGVEADGGLGVVRLGSPVLPSLDGEYCRIRTRDGRIYTGTILSRSPSVHVFPDAQTRPRDEANLYVRIDEPVGSREDVLALGIRTGDYICFDPKNLLTERGFLKSRFLDDKAGAAVLLTLLKVMRDSGRKPACRTCFCFTTHEEIGYGGSTLPRELAELLVVDMGCVGAGLSCTERQVSICAKDRVGPYDYEMTNRLLDLAGGRGIDAAMDIYPHYASDARTAWESGHDTRAALIGPGVHASHGMERTHLDGLMNTLKLAAAYLGLLD